jgi:hypothetical protein
MGDDSHSSGTGPRPGSAAWWFTDRRTGAVVIGQFPNAPLWILLATIAARPFLATDSGPDIAARWVGAAALAWWAGDEVLRGVNPWRRLLGAAGTVLAATWVVGLASGS